MAPPMTDGPQLDTQLQFAALRQRYVAGLGQRWAEIIGAAEASTLQSALHRLCGSAASFGFEEIGRCAKEAERLASQGSGQVLKQALQALKVEIERAGSNTAGR
jgi:HPt (histidine-containing phosphotransfer) domain-containing protein